MNGPGSGPEARAISVDFWRKAVPVRRDVEILSPMPTSPVPPSSSTFLALPVRLPG
jgi:hypothetical protein